MAKCQPWMGEVDMTSLTPINDNGEPVILGIRKCGNTDCVEPKHIVNMAALVAEQFNRYYVTKQKRGYFQLIADLRKEAHA